LSTESTNNTEQEAPVVSALASEANQPLTVNVPSGNLSNITASGLVNFYYPFSPQTFNTVATSVTNATITGTVNVVVVTGTGWASVNNAGFVFQTDQYNSRREGGGQ